MAERRAKVTTEVGIQARPATVFVATAGESRTDVQIAKPDGDPHDAKSILAVLTLDVRSGDEIVLTGDDEGILDRLVALVSQDVDQGGADIGDIDEG